MLTSSLFLLTGLLATAHAVVVPQGQQQQQLEARRGGNDCPAVWTDVNKQLNSLFLNGDQCNDLARAAIRAVFHDCGSWDTSQGFSGGCDGSLVLGTSPDVELNRAENRGLQTIAGVLKNLAAQYNTTVADMVVFAGNAAIFLCPGGPKVKTFVGRKDSTASAKAGGLPDVFDTASNLYGLFQKKGYGAEDLAALLGAHSTSTQFFVDESAKNKSQDSTPGKWDVTYYQETYNFATRGTAPPGVFVFPSDSKLSTFDEVGKRFQGFIGNQGKWASSFSKAMGVMALFGNNPNNMADCTNVIARV